MRRVVILSTITHIPSAKNGRTRHVIVHDSMVARTLKKMTEERFCGAHVARGSFAASLLFIEAGRCRILATRRTHRRLAARTPDWSHKHGRTAAAAVVDVATRTGIDEFNPDL